MGSERLNDEAVRSVVEREGIPKFLFGITYSSSHDYEGNLPSDSCSVSQMLSGNDKSTQSIQPSHMNTLRTQQFFIKDI